MNGTGRDYNPCQLVSGIARLASCRLVSVSAPLRTLTSGFASHYSPPDRQGARCFADGFAVMI